MKSNSEYNERTSRRPLTLNQYSEVYVGRFSRMFPSYQNEDRPLTVTRFPNEGRL
jgi:hypothetical protein